MTRFFQRPSIDSRMAVIFAYKETSGITLTLNSYQPLVTWRRAIVAGSVKYAVHTLHLSAARNWEVTYVPTDSLAAGRVLPTTDTYNLQPKFRHHAVMS